MYKVRIETLMIEASRINNKRVTDNIHNITGVTLDLKKSVYHYILNGNMESMKVDEWITTYQSDKYEVSRRGEVRSKKRGSILKPSYSPYANINLAGKRASIHKIVMLSFMGLDTCEERNEINHIDLNKRNNTLGNLEWCTRQENLKHYWEESGRLVPYRDMVGKKFEGGKDGAFEVLNIVESNNSQTKFHIRFVNSGNEKNIIKLSLDTGNPIDNFYKITKPSGEVVIVRSLTTFNDEVNSSRLSDIMHGKLKEWNGWKVCRANNQIAK